MTNFKVGDKVRILSLDGALAGFKIGDEAVIKQSKLDGSKEGGAATYSVTNGKAYGYCDAIHIELVNAQPTKKQRISTLEAQVAELKAEVEALKQAQGGGNTAAKLAELVAAETGKHRKKASLTPNEQRKAIIAEAKAFVADYDGREIGWRETPTSVDAGPIYVDLYSNPKKRVTTAIVRWANVAGVRDRIFAKCAPTDVFNADIGKAIALGRALGLDVSKFEQAVQPTEVVVGHIVTFPKTDSWYMRHNYRVDSLEVGENLTVVYNDIDGLDSRIGGKARQYGGFTLDTIIDDTEAQYE